MLVPQTFRYGRDVGLDELNEILKQLHPSQINSFEARAKGDTVELVLVWDDEEKFDLIETHPHFGIQLTPQSTPSEAALLFSAPVSPDNTELYFVQSQSDVIGGFTTTQISGDRISILDNYILRVDLSDVLDVSGELTSGEYSLYGRVYSQKGTINDGACLLSFRINDGVDGFAHHFGAPNHSDDGIMRCGYFVVDRGASYMDVVGISNEILHTREEDILFMSTTQIHDHDEVFIIYWEHKFPNLKSSDPGHGEVFNVAPVYGYFGFDRKLGGYFNSSGDFGDIYFDGNLVTGEVIDPDRKVVRTVLPASQIEGEVVFQGDYGPHWYAFVGLQDYKGGIRKRPIILSYAYDYNANGSVGPQGPAGADGAQGSQGPQGDAGGPQGPQGDDGAAGPQGPQGDDGAAGPQGPQGPQGYQGAPGNPGAAGPQGPQGYQGYPGNPGSAGPQGDQGYQGDPGAQGAQGAQGPQGSTPAVTPSYKQLDGPDGTPTEGPNSAVTPGVTEVGTVDVAQMPYDSGASNGGSVPDDGSWQEIAWTLVVPEDIEVGDTWTLNIHYCISGHTLGSADTAVMTVSVEQFSDGDPADTPSSAYETDVSIMAQDTYDVQTDSSLSDTGLTAGRPISVKIRRYDRTGIDDRLDGTINILCAYLSWA